MKIHRFTSHSPEEMRRLSDLGHRVEGVLLAAVGILAILGGADIAGGTAIAWPILLLVAGVALLILIYPLHPPSDWSLIWRDPQQRQHTIMAAAVALAGTAELLRAGSTGGALWGYVWPGVLLLIGVLFLVHTQHGQGTAVARAVLLHRVLGGTIVAAGLFRLAEVITGAGTFALLWPLLLLAAAAQLLIYREPAGAFEAESGHGGHG